MNSSLSIFSKYLILCSLTQVTPIVATAHDLAGLKMVDSLPTNIANKIKTNELLRLPSVQKEMAKAQNMPPIMAAKYLKSRGLPTKLASNFESIFSNTLWQQNREIKICFLDGIDSSRQMVILAMQTITSQTNLNLNLATPNCDGSNGDIRVTFKLTGFSSYVGTDNLLIPYPLETLRLSGMDKSTWSNYENGVALHELMHAIGALHEHQNPLKKCQSEYNIPYIKSSLNWTDNDMKVNFYDIPRNQIGAISAYDDKSVMHYQLNEKFFIKGNKSPCFIQEVNNTLSDGDVAMLNKIYPK